MARLSLKLYYWGSTPILWIPQAQTQLIYNLQNVVCDKPPF